MWPALFFSPSSHCSGSRSLYIHSGTHTLYMPSFCWQQGLTCRMSGVTCSINPRHIRGESMQHTACCAAHHTTVQLNNTHTHTCLLYGQDGTSQRARLHAAWGGLGRAGGHNLPSGGCRQAARAGNQLSSLLASAGGLLGGAGCTSSAVCSLHSLPDAC